MDVIENFAIVHWAYTIAYRSAVNGTCIAIGGVSSITNLIKISSSIGAIVYTANAA